MKTELTYYILNYFHSQFLGEKVNVGILFHSKNPSKIIFKYPKNFKRIRELYNDFTESQLKLNLNVIEERINYLNNNNSLFFNKDGENIIDELFRRDATTLLFSEGKRAIVDNNIELAIKDYYNLYFSNYHEPERKLKHDEEYLLRTFKNRLSTRNSSAHLLLKKDIHIKSPQTVMKFDYKWKNGVENLVKSVGFDLEEESSINHKAILIYGQLNFISEELRNKNYNVDLLISRPETKNKGLLDAYDRGIKIINTANISKNIIEEDKVDVYIDRVAKDIKPSY